jgi:hypothetical protein
VACAVAAAATGCGGGGDSGTTTAASQPAVASSAPQKGPDGLEKVAARCQTATERSLSPEVVPAEFKPTHARVVAAKRTSNGFTAQLLYDRSVTQVFRAIKSATQAAGYQVQREENEGRDAELFLQHNGTPSEVRLTAVSACPQYATATVETG